jgi:hypothetical protein
MHKINFTFVGDERGEIKGDGLVGVGKSDFCYMSAPFSSNWFWWTIEN